MHTSRSSMILALSAFAGSLDADADKVTQITPDAATRLAFQKDEAGNYVQVVISDKLGPQNDGMTEVIDTIYFAADEIDVSGVDRALVVRMQTDELTDDAIQAIGTTLEAYMDKNRTSEFATAAIHDIGQDQELFGRWTTIVFTRDYDGKWSAKNLGFTSVQKSTDSSFAILRDGQMAKVSGNAIVGTLLDDTKLQATLDGGYELKVDGDDADDGYLVRAPINKGGAYAVVGQGFQTVYNDQFQVIASGQTGFTVMPAIDVDGTYTDKVTTVSGNGNDWDVRNAIDPRKADSLARAFGASAD